jgi:hypothetical protein
LDAETTNCSLSTIETLGIKNYSGESNWGVKKKTTNAVDEGERKNCSMACRKCGSALNHIAAGKKNIKKGRLEVYVNA